MMQILKDPTFVVAAIIQHPTDETVLIVRRGPSQSGAGFWEFAGGKVELGEGPEEALHREIREELGVSIEIESILGEIIHTYPTRTIRLRVYMARTESPVLSLHEHDASAWVLPAKLKKEILSEADRPFVEKLLWHLDILNN